MTLLIITRKYPNSKSNYIPIISGKGNLISRRSRDVANPNRSAADVAGPRRRSEARDDSDLETTFPKRLRPRGKETIGIWWRGKRRIFTAKRIEKSRLEYNGAEIGLIARSRSGFLRGTRVKTRKSRAKVVSRGRRVGKGVEAW